MVGAVHAPCEKVLSVRAPLRPVLAALVVAASLSITGCASSTASGSVLDAVKIEGSDPAAAPTVTISCTAATLTRPQSRLRWRAVLHDHGGGFGGTSGESPQAGSGRVAGAVKSRRAADAVNGMLWW